MTGTEDLLRRSLHARAERTTYEPTRVLDVAGRAREMRRARTRTHLLAAAAAVAAVIAVAVPVGMLLGGDDRSTPDPAPSPSSVVTTTVGALDDLPRGAEPRVDYVDDRTYVTADGSRTDVPVANETPLVAVAPYRGGLLFTSGAGGVSGFEVSWVDAEGDTRWTRCGSDRIAVSDDDRVIGYATADGGGDCGAWTDPLLTWGLADGPDDVGEQAALSGELADPVAVTDEEMIHNASDAVTGDPLGAYLTPLGGTPEQVPGLEVATAYHSDSRTVAGLDRDGVGVLADVDTGAVRLRFEDGRAPVAFSPDGRYVVSALFVGGTESPITVHDVATGAEVLVVSAPEPGGTLPDPTAVAWEDGTHLLLGTLTTSSQAIVRIGLDGRVELATPPGRETLAGFSFPSRS